MPIPSRSRMINNNTTGRRIVLEDDLDASTARNEGNFIRDSLAYKEKPRNFSLERTSGANVDLHDASISARQSLADIPHILVDMEERTAPTCTGKPVARNSLSKFGVGRPFASPETDRGLHHSKISPSCRESLHNNIDGSDAYRYRRPRRKLTMDPMQEPHVPQQADRVSVYVRVRPMSRKEKEKGARCCVQALNKNEIFLTDTSSNTDHLRLKRMKGRYFVFDGVFGYDTSQEEIYTVSASQLVQGVLEGRNLSIFCYGATGAGKTFTMLGTVSEPGVMILAIEDLFMKLSERTKERDHSVYLSYLEVYNETVKDLISPGRALVLREDARQGIVATGLTEYKVSSVQEVMALLQQGNRNRTTEPTRLNETSSRSHAILQVMVQCKRYVDLTVINRTGKLSLIDLAGSEKADATDQRTLRSFEGANINRALLALSTCISALAEGKKHIPFRNSKLTQLLKDSLGGSCQTVMIANISPSDNSFSETQNTLYWAERAKDIRTVEAGFHKEEVQIPILMGEQHLQLLRELQKENQQLKMQVARLEQRLLFLESKSTATTQTVETQVGESENSMGSSIIKVQERSTDKDKNDRTDTSDPAQEPPPSLCSEDKENGRTSGRSHLVEADNGMAALRAADSRDSGVEQLRSEEVVSLRDSLANRQILKRNPLKSHSSFHTATVHKASITSLRKCSLLDVMNMRGTQPGSAAPRYRGTHAARKTPSMLVQISIIMFSSHANPFQRLVTCFDYVLQKRFTGG